VIKSENPFGKIYQLFDPSYPFPDDGYKGVDIRSLAEAYRDENRRFIKGMHKRMSAKRL
jgi:hypothetical protein